MKRRRLGQHYLVDRAVVGKLVALAAIRTGERVLEVGTGRGILTKELCGRASWIEGYEVDPDNYRATVEAVGGAVKMHLADAFERRPEFDVLVSSLPYSRSSSFMDWISKLPYDRAVVLLQEDFVRKVLARPGQRDYRAVSVIAQASSEISIVERVRRSAFSPEPRVNSVIVSMKPKGRLSDEVVSLIKRFFALRRREVGAAVAKLSGEPSGGDRRRVYTLTPDEVLRLVARLH